MTSKGKRESRRKIVNVLEEDADDESGDQDDHRVEAVNRSLATEQDAVRRRTQAYANEHSGLYDYDGTYDTFHQSKSQEIMSKDNKEESKTESSNKSRYVADLLKASKKRQHERDIVRERKIAREQAEEEEKQEEFRGKEKFVTASYKRKLEERRVWLEEEEKQRLEDERNDVTKKSAGEAMAGFYGNFKRNVAMGGDNSDPNKVPDVTERGLPEETKEVPGFDFLEGFEPAVGERNEQAASSMNETATNTLVTLDSKQTLNNTDKDENQTKRFRLNELRRKLVAEARVRYFERKGLKGAEA